MDAVPLLQSLIQAAGRGPHAVLAAMEAPLRAAGLTPRATRSEPRAILWSRGDPTLVLSGHVDVVPVGEGWVRDAYGGAIDEGRVWGRGACDMLGSVACFAEAASRAEGDVGILLTTDEETTMRAAQNAITEGLLADVEGIVIGEPTEFSVGIAEKGVLWTRLSTRGKNAHGSMPHLGDNAAERMVRVLGALQSVRLEGEHPLLGRPTMNLGTLRSGEAVNQVPASAQAEMDIRYLPGTRSDDVLAKLRAATREAFDVEIHADHVPFEVAPDSRLARAALDAGATAPLGLPYGTEASKFAPAGIPCIILGPGEASLAHTNRESIRLDAMKRGADVYERIIEAWS